MNSKPIEVDGMLFNSVTEASKHYNISTCVIRHRMNNGWSINKTFTTPVRMRKKPMDPIDHNGVRYDSIQQMCDIYGVNRQTFNTEFRNGKSIEEILTRNRRDKEITDHKGQVFKNTRRMCEHYNIDQPYYIKHIKEGDNLENILSHKTKHRKPVYDHEGNKFDTIYKMCDYWHLPLTTYQNRKSLGWPIKAILLGPEYGGRKPGSGQKTLKKREFSNAQISCTKQCLRRIKSYFEDQGFKVSYPMIQKYSTEYIFPNGKINKIFSEVSVPTLSSEEITAILASIKKIVTEQADKKGWKIRKFNLSVQHVLSIKKCNTALNKIEVIKQCSRV